MTSHLISYGDQEKEIEDRRRVHARIVELKASCHNLAHHRDQLQSRLESLNKTVDQLLAERDKKATPFASTQQQAPVNRTQNTTSNKAHSSVVTKQQQQPSEIFKLRLASSLRDMEPKAQEIASLAEILIQKQNPPL